MQQDIDWVVLELALESRLSRANGNEFQNLFSDMMERVYGDDFVRVKPHGNIGDQGVDGCFFCADTIFQCYGAVDGKVQRLTDVAAKMRSDFDTALAGPTKMREWRFTHNLLSGLPKPLLDVLIELKEKGESRGVKVGQFGRPSFLDLIQKLDPHSRERILGTKAIAADRLRALPEAVNVIIDEIMQTADYVPPDDPPQPISVRKLTHNDIPSNWQRLLKQGFEHGPLVFQCISRNGDPTAPNSVPAFVNTLYVNLALHELDPGDILRQIHGELCGVAAPRFDDDRSYAALAVMAAMFESCEIFEDPADAELEA
jgi:hypothetical protein